MLEIKECDRWIQFSEEYDIKVFSLTKNPERRKQILEKIKIGKILNLGCGSTSYLNRDLIKQGNHVTAIDFCQSMIDVSKREFSDKNLEFELVDAINMPYNNNLFDSVISINSILPPERNEIYKIINEIYRVLIKGGKFVSFLTSFDSCVDLNKNYNINLELDEEHLRVIDTTGCQCFHTKESIINMLKLAGFLNYNIEKVLLNSDEEISEIERLYGINTSKYPVYEYLVTATK